MNKIPLLTLLSAMSVSAYAAPVIVNNNTGLNPASFQFLDLNSATAGTYATTGVGNIVATLSGTFGSDSDSAAFGSLSMYGSTDSTVSYNFTELTAATQYRVYMNWYGNAIANCAAAVSLNGVSTGADVLQTNSSGTSANGFQAYNSGVGTDASPGYYFVQVGTAFADANGDLVVLIQKGAQSFFRSDAIAVAPVPEPGTYGLLGAGALAGVSLVRRRRRR